MGASTQAGGKYSSIYFRDSYVILIHGIGFAKEYGISYYGCSHEPQDCHLHPSSYRPRNVRGQCSRPDPWRNQEWQHQERRSGTKCACAQSPSSESSSPLNAKAGHTDTNLYPDQANSDQIRHPHSHQDDSNISGPNAQHTNALSNAKYTNGSYIPHPKYQ